MVLQENLLITMAVISTKLSQNYLLSPITNKSGPGIRTPAEYFIFLPSLKPCCFS